MDIERTIERNANYGYYHLDRKNYSDILGADLESRENDAILIDILNPEFCEKAQPISDSMVMQETHKDVTSVLSGLAALALSSSYGQKRVRYIDMNKVIESRRSAEGMSRRIKRLHDVRPSVLSQLVLVNGSVDIEDDRYSERKRQRARKLTATLSELPESIFRVGLIASPEFAEVLGLSRATESTSETPSEPQATHRPIAVAS